MRNSLTKWIKDTALEIAIETLYTIETIGTLEMLDITIETLSRHWRRSVVVIANSEQISHIILMFTLLTFNE